jgi:hypothetical protein
MLGRSDDRNWMLLARTEVNRQLKAASMFIVAVLQGTPFNRICEDRGLLVKFPLLPSRLGDIPPRPDQCAQPVIKLGQ